jgi:hypothetical protein
VLCLGKVATGLFWDEPPHRNTWHTFDMDGEKLIVGVTAHPSYLLRSMMANYKEYYATKMFLRRLASGMDRLQKVRRWTLTPRYVQNFVVGGLPMSGSPADVVRTEGTGRKEEK